MRLSNNPIIKVLGLRDFRLLWSGSGLSVLGDQFALIATPWLVLLLTGNSLVLGTVLALEGIPRALLLLLGGAITDTFSQRSILLLSDLARLLLTAGLAAAVFTGTVQLWMVYAFSLMFGILSGISTPAANSFVPRIVPVEKLQAGNSLMMGTIQLVSFVGPSAAGVLIASFAKSPTGIALAFAIDALSFGASVTALWFMKAGRGRSSVGERSGESVWGSIVAGFQYLWHEPETRRIFIIVSISNLFVGGAMLVGIPVLAEKRLPEGAVAFGLLMSAYGGGNLVGYVLAGALPRPGPRLMMLFIPGLVILLGTITVGLGMSQLTWIDVVMMLVWGCSNGYFAIIIFTQIQTRTPEVMMGRMMSMLFFSQSALVPVSQALAGVLSQWSLMGMFTISGTLTVLLGLWVGISSAFQGLKICQGRGTRRRNGFGKSFTGLIACT